jgi:hypothetical protein
MCLDAGRPPRRDKGVVALWKCEAGNSNQAWVIDGDQVDVKDTLSLHCDARQIAILTRKRSLVRCPLSPLGST